MRNAGQFLSTAVIAICFELSASSNVAHGFAPETISITGSDPFVEKQEIGPTPNFEIEMGDSVASWRDPSTGATWLVAGAEGENNNQGAAYIFSRPSDSQPWHQEARITAADGKVNDRFAYAVAIEGNLVVLGAPFAGPSHNGQVYIFSADSSGIWKPVGTPLAIPSTSGFGYRVALFGERLAVSAPFSGTGHVFVYELGTSGWTLLSSLSPPDLMSPIEFGYSVGFNEDGQRLLIGAPYDSSSLPYRGSAYVFNFTATTNSWDFFQKLGAGLDGAANDQIGTSVGIKGNSIALGAPGRNSSQGAVVTYAFDLISGTWNETAPLIASDGSSSDAFGDSLIFSGERLIVGATGHNGAAGAIYAFSGAPTWTQMSEVQRPTTTNRPPELGNCLSSAGASVFACAPYANTNFEYGGEIAEFSSSATSLNENLPIVPSDDNHEYFGGVIAANSDAIAISSQTDTQGADGAVDIYGRNTNGDWIWQTHLTGIGTAPSLAMASDNDTLLIGNYQQSFGTRFNQGAAYAFQRTTSDSGTYWAQTDTLADLVGGAAYDEFGSSVALAGNTAVIGASNSNSGQGSAYIYVKSGDAWDLQAKLTAGDAANTQQLGSTVAIQGNLVFLAGQDLMHEGVVYVYQRAGSEWTQIAKLHSPDSSSQDSFGASIAATDSETVIGAPRQMIGSHFYVGRVYVFSNTAWTLTSVIDTPDVNDYAYFGARLSLDGTRLAIGEEGQLSVLIYSKTSDAWTNETVLRGAIGQFGQAVALSSSNLAVGAWTEGQNFGGRAYIFQDDQIFANGFQP